MALMMHTDTDWRVVHKGGRTSVFWKEHDVSKWVTKVDWENRAGGHAKANVTVLANVEATLTVEECRSAATSTDKNGVGIAIGARLTRGELAATCVLPEATNSAIVRLDTGELVDAKTDEWEVWPE